MPRDLPGAAAVVRSIGSALGRAERAEEIACDIERRTARVREMASAAPRVDYAYLIWRRPYMTLNRDTYVSALLGEAGGRNVFGDREERYPDISPDELRDADPRVVLLSSEPFPFKQPHIDELVATTGLAADRFHLVDGELLSWHGPRSGVGVEYARGVLADHAPSLGA